MNYGYYSFKKRAKMGIIGDIAGAAGTAAGILGIGQKRQDERQVKQQGKLTDQQVRANKELADYNQKLQMDMWQKTNYGAQMAELKEAGLNPGLMYGMGGGGGTTTGSGGAGSASGGQAANAAATQQAQTAMGMQMAQMGLLQAQTEKTKAETANLGAGTTKTGEETVGIKFQNEMNQLMKEDVLERSAWATTKLNTEASKELAEYNAWLASGFEGKPTDDPKSPIARAMSAGLLKSLEELKGAKLNNSATEATNVVKRFEANLAENGIHPHSPWWVKIVGDLLAKAGITTMIQAGATGIK